MNAGRGLLGSPQTGMNTGRHMPESGEPQPVYCCRFCRAPLRDVFVDLGTSPLCESYRTREQLDQMEPFYPLCVYICSRCYLVQLPEYVHPASIFAEYAYFSSYSDSWLEHAARYVDAAVGRFNLSNKSLVVEIASNDGYLLQYFTRRGIPVLGIEPAANIACVAVARGIPTEVKFFGVETALELIARNMRPDLLLGNNVLAHVPHLNDFVAGLKILLSSSGVITMEFPHLLRLVEGNQFDTIYHEHFSYFSFSTVDRIFSSHELTIFDVEELPTHGGSLRIYARHSQCDRLPAGPRVAELKEREKSAGYGCMERYAGFAESVKSIKRELLATLIELKREGKKVAGYGAPGKGTTLLNYCGIRTDMLDYTVDRNPYKHGKYLPGTGIPVYPVEHIGRTRPDYLLVLPWNLKDEIVNQMGYIRDWGGKFIIPIPSLAVIE